MGTNQERIHNLEQQLSALISRIDCVNPQNTTFNDPENILQPAQLAQFLTAALAAIVESRLRRSDRDTVLIIRFLNNEQSLARLGEADRHTIASISRRHLVGYTLLYRATTIDHAEHSFQHTGIELSTTATSAAATAFTLGI